MKSKVSIFFLMCALLGVGYPATEKWAVRHQRFTFYDATRNGRAIAVDVAVRRDRELGAIAGVISLPVAVLSHGNTVRFTEYSFLENLLAARGYLAISIQHDTDGDAPLVTRTGESYVGRSSVYERGVANILYAISRMKLVQAGADYEHLTLLGHSNGGDISMYFAKLHPELVKKVVTLDNLRVPLVSAGKFKILTFRSNDANFRADPGVVPDPYLCAKFGIKVVQTEYQHTEMSDRGPDQAKAALSAALEKFLDDETSSPPPLPEMFEPEQSEEINAGAQSTEMR